MFNHIRRTVTGLLVAAVLVTALLGGALTFGTDLAVNADAGAAEVVDGKPSFITPTPGPITNSDVPMGCDDNRPC